MFGKFSRSWSLIKASASVLRSDSELLVFPLLSSVAALLVLITFVGPVVLLQGVDPRAAGYDEMSWPMLIWLFAFYLVNYFVIFFFNTALVGAAMIRLDGGNPTVSDGLRIAMSRARMILGYAVIAATVGLLLQLVRERSGALGRWISGLLGLAWTVATFLVVPVLVSHKIGPIDALKESAQLLRKTWGENLIGNGGIGVVGGLAVFGTVVLGVVACVLAFVSGSVILGVVLVVLTVLAVLAIGLIQSALSAIYSAALYRYASGGSLPKEFEPRLLENAFASR